jgi:hypothetical protein
MGTPWVRKTIGLGQFQRTGLDAEKAINSFVSAYYLSNAVHRRSACSRFDPFPKLSVEGSIPFARSNDFNDLVAQGRSAETPRGT